MTIYTLTLIANKYVRVGEEYEFVEADLEFKYRTFDNLMAALGHMIVGNEGGSIKFQIKTTQVKEADYE